MLLKETGLTAQDIKNKVGKYMNVLILWQTLQKICMFMMKTEMSTLTFTRELL